MFHRPASSIKSSLLPRAERYADCPAPNATMRHATLNARLGARDDAPEWTVGATPLQPSVLQQVMLVRTGLGFFTFVGVDFLFATDSHTAAQSYRYTFCVDWSDLIATERQNAPDVHSCGEPWAVGDVQFPPSW